jgi:hypothetical protein
VSVNEWLRYFHDTVALGIVRSNTGWCPKMDGASSGRLTNPQPWRENLPPAVFQGLLEWVKGQPFDLTHCRRLTGGQSGSIVALVRVQPPRGVIHGAVLKLLPRKLATRESRAVQLAEQYGPEEFVASHMVRTTWSGPLPGSSGCWLHMQDVAQDDLVAVRELGQLTADPRFAEYCATIVATLCSAWNGGPDDPPLSQVGGAGAFLRQDLSNEAGLRTFATAAGLDVEKPPADIEFPGRTDPLPNPLALIAPDSAEQHTVEVFLGKVHGDLNLGNVLVPVERDGVRPERFRLIDMGRFSPKKPVSRDPAKLLLSVAEAWLPHVAPGSPLRSRLAELIVAPLECRPSPAVVGYLHVAEEIYKAAASWAVSRRCVEDWARQHGLVLAASALRAVARPTVAMPDRWWYLEVAALALRPLVRPIRAEASPPGTRSGADPSRRPAAPPPIGGRPTYPGPVKLEVCRRLGEDWLDLAAHLGVRPHERARYRAGHEAGCVWDWLEVRGRLGELRGALAAIGREDLVDVLDHRHPHR